MKAIPPLLLADLSADCTTLAFLWAITLGNGRVIRGTEHDRDITIPPASGGAPAADDGYQVLAPTATVNPPDHSSEWSGVDFINGCYFVWEPTAGTLSVYDLTTNTQRLNRSIASIVPAITGFGNGGITVSSNGNLLAWDNSSLYELDPNSLNLLHGPLAHGLNLPQGLVSASVIDYSGASIDFMLLNGIVPQGVWEWKQFSPTATPFTLDVSSANYKMCATGGASIPGQRLDFWLVGGHTDDAAINVYRVSYVPKTSAQTADSWASALTAAVPVSALVPGATALKGDISRLLYDPTDGGLILEDVWNDATGTPVTVKINPLTGAALWQLRDASGALQAAMTGGGVITEGQFLYFANNTLCALDTMSGVLTTLPHDGTFNAYGSSSDADVVVAWNTAPYGAFVLTAPVAAAGATDYSGTYRGIANITFSDIVSSSDMSVDNLQASGAFPDTNPPPVVTYLDVTVDEIEAGVCDGAPVAVLVCNWARPDHGYYIAKCGTLGAINRDSDGKYTTEVRGMTQPLTQGIIRTYAVTCNVVKFGDARCKYHVAAVTTTGYATAASADPLQCAVSIAALAVPPKTLSFVGGTLTFTGGANAGYFREVKLDPNANGGVVGFWEPFPEPISLGDRFKLSAGCDRTKATCKMYGNLANFRGFGVYVPGINAMMEGPKSGTASSPAAAFFENQ